MICRLLTNRKTPYRYEGTFKILVITYVTKRKYFVQNLALGLGDIEIQEFFDVITSY